MATTAAPLRPVDDAPDVRAALARLEPLARQAALLDERQRRYVSNLDPHIAMHQPVPSVDERLEAEAELPSVRVAYARVLRDLREADAALTAARVEERARLRLAFLARQRALAPRLLAAWRAAQTIHDEWAALIGEEGHLLGAAGHYDLLVGGFQRATPTQGCAIDDWVRGCREAGILGPTE